MSIPLARSIVLFACVIASGCSITQRHPDIRPVRIIFHNELPSLSKANLHDCDYLGTVISSEGHWYDFIYISNNDLATGAINKMHNLASDMGANMVYIDNNIDFRTSVTFIGQAYHCEAVTSH